MLEENENKEVEENVNKKVEENEEKEEKEEKEKSLINNGDNEHIEDASDNLLKEEKSKTEALKEKKKLIAIIFLSCLIIVSIIVFSLVFDFFPDLFYGRLECTYYGNGNDTSIINKDFDLDDNSIKIKINNKDEYEDEIPSYNSEDNFTVEIKLMKKDFSMKNMFKNTSIMKIKMISKLSGKINSFENTFENCKYLEKFENEDLDTSEVESMEKMFYNTTNLKEVIINKTTIKDLKNISYMFANSNIKDIHLENFGIDVIINSKNVFDNLKSNVYLKNIGKEKKDSLESKYPNIKIVNVTN